MTRRQVLKLGAVGGAAAAFVVAAAQGRELVVAFSIDPGPHGPAG